MDYFVQTGQISGKQSSIQTVEKQGRRKRMQIADAFAEDGRNGRRRQELSWKDEQSFWKVLFSY